MIKLSEIMNSIDEKNKEGFINVDDWRWPDLDYLISMGFELNDDYRLGIDNPKITIYKKKDTDQGGEPAEFFFVEEPNREVKRFSAFNDVIDYFDSYAQPEIDKNLK